MASSRGFFKKGFNAASVIILIMILAVPFLSGCTAFEKSATGGVIATSYLGTSPTNEIEQIYYLGVFDPQEQVPPTIYRVRVHGQAGAISQMSFGSGWVKADLIDSLGTNLEFKKGESTVGISKAEDEVLTSLKPGKRLMIFGPEGFREAPEGHRLVIVMGSSPEGFFNAVDEALGEVSAAKAELRNSALINDLFKALQRLDAEGGRLNALSKDVAAELPADKN